MFSFVSHDDEASRGASVLQHEVTERSLAATWQPGQKRKQRRLQVACCSLVMVDKSKRSKSYELEDIRVKVKRNAGQVQPCGAEMVGFITCLDINNADENRCVTQRDMLSSCMAAAQRSGWNKRRHKMPINFHLQTVRNHHAPCRLPFFGFAAVLLPDSHTRKDTAACACAAVLAASRSASCCCVHSSCET